MSSPIVFSRSFRVYYEHTDAGGVVYHANYLNFMAQTRTEFLRELGVELVQLEREVGVLFAVRSVSVDYRRPARLDDLIQVSLGLGEIRPASLTFEQRIDREGETLCSGEVRVASLSSDRFRPVPLPDGLQGLLEEVVRSGMPGHRKG